MTPTEARSLIPGDRVEFADPALVHCCFPVRGVVCWIVRGESEIGANEVGISWEGLPAVSENPATDFEHIQRIDG